MSTTAQLWQQLQQEITFELITANQLLQQISAEIEIIKKFTSPGGEFELNVKENASLMKELMRLQNIDLSSIPLLNRENQETTEQNTLIEETTMDES